MADMTMPEGMPMDPMMGGGMPPMDPMMGGGMPPVDPMMGGGMPPMDPMMSPEGEAPMEEMGEQLAEEGRGGDEVIGHLTAGEIVIPVDIQDESLMEFLEDHFADHGVSILQYTVGTEQNSINPETGMPEFFNDPRRTWAQRSSYWGYTGAERPTSSVLYKGNLMKTSAPTMEDYRRFDRYIRSYAGEEKKKQSGYGFHSGTRGHQQAKGIIRYGGKKAEPGTGMADYQSLTKEQRKGPWRHAARLQSKWDSMSETAKRKEFEDWHRTVTVERASPYAGAWAGAGSKWFRTEGGRRPLKGTTPYKTMAQEQREAAHAKTLAAEEAAYRAKLERERVRLETEAKTRAIRKARQKSGEAVLIDGEPRPDAAAIGSITDPRSMVSKSYSRRSSGAPVSFSRKSSYSKTRPA
jgi:hypothetical protein